ncbi:MAG: ATP-grasp domain-containing protein [Acidobacteriota bacterium]
MRTVVFVCPFAFEITLRFAAAAADHPATRLVLISQDRPETFPDAFRRKLGGHLVVDNAFSVQQVADAIRKIAAQTGGIHCLLGTLEQLQEPLAGVREELGLPGVDVEVATNFRDKARMKDVLQEAGLPCARHRRLTSVDEGREFVREVGYPIVIKPLAGAGSKGTYRVASDDEFQEVLAVSPPHPRRPVLAEEFMQGEEHSFDGVMLGGELVWHSLTHYRPAPLEVVRNPWIQYCVLMPREVEHPRYDDIRQAATASVKALGLRHGVFHMEWFRRPNGEVAISEVGARPGGAQISRLLSWAHDFSFYAAWAGIMIDGVFEPPPRHFSAGVAFLRGQGEGRVRHIRGLGQAQRELGHLVVETNLPKLGQMKASSYEGEGFVVLRHRETRVVEEALRRLITLVRIELG